MKEVAKRANVSVATVSRVLNRKGQVREDTRQRVLEATQVLNYVPNGTARSLKMQKTQTLGALLPDLYGEFFTGIIRGIDRTVYASQYHLLTSGSHDDEDELEAVLKALQGRVDGLLVISSRISSERLEALLPRSLPVVVVGGDAATGHRFGTVGFENYQGARDIVAHLAGHGYERIAMLKGPHASHDAAERLRGYRDALRAAGLSLDPGLEIEGDYMRRTGYERALVLAEQPNPPAALFAANDAMAMGALSAFHEAGLDVPGDIAVAGFDGIPSAQYMAPSLTTLRVPVEEIGACAAERLIAAAERGSSLNGWRKTFPVRPALRASCGCVSSRE